MYRVRLLCLHFSQSLGLKFDILTSNCIVQLHCQTIRDNYRLTCPGSSNPRLAGLACSVAKMASMLRIRLVTIGAPMVGMSVSGCKSTQVQCMPHQGTNGICRAIEVGSSAMQGLAALEQLCEKCRKGREQWGKDPCSKIEASTFHSVVGGKGGFTALENDLLEISASIKKEISKVEAGDTEKNQILSTVLYTVNGNLQGVQDLKKKMNKLNFDTSALENGLLQYTDFWQEASQKLHFRITAAGYDKKNALNLHVYNPCREEFVCTLPAGALFKPVKKDCQNLVLKAETQIRVKPGERKTITLWALCGNSNKASPFTDMEPTDLILNCDRSNQSSLWAATKRYEK